MVLQDAGEARLDLPLHLAHHVIIADARLAIAEASDGKTSAMPPGATFLASDDVGFFTVAVLPLDGGITEAFTVLE